MAPLAAAPAAATTATVYALPTAGRRKLRVGVVADSAHQPRWIVESLAKAADVAEIAFVCITGAKKSSLTPVLSIYRSLDRRVFGDPLSEPRDVTALVASARRMTAEEFSRSEAPLDLIFALGDVDASSLAGRARYGVWRYCFGDGHDTCEPMAGVGEALKASPVTASGIRIRIGDGTPDRIACASWARTLPLSVARSRGNLLAKTGQFLARALRDLHDAPDTWLERDTVPAAANVDTAPSTGLLRDISRVGTRIAQRAAEKLLTIEQWSLAYRFADSEAWDGSLTGFHRLEPPKDRFWADPFPIQRNGRSYIFFEELPFAAGRAHISVVEVDRQGRASQPERVLERDFHISYPFLIEDGGELYMIPETAANHTIEIYRCVAFPNQWRRERVLVDGVFCADATVYRESADRWWMFANSCAPGADIYDELHLFSADSLLGEWRPHRRNPVKSDVRSARPAGNLFRQDGELYRPAQICAPIYGAGVALNRVTRLDEDGFCEEVVRRILPQDSAILGLHTINRAGDLSVADTFVRRSRF